MSNKQQHAADKGDNKGENNMLSFAQKRHLRSGIGGLFLSASLFSFAALTISSANASGSFGGGGSSGAHSSYNLGKSLFHKKLICNQCPADGIQMNKKGAKDLIMNLEEQEDFASDLNAKNRKAVIAYLSRRFKVN